jgi:HCOMODA/2-hydroxy-3-carboxy-muconic semialdehyde decarboxylase
MPVVNTLPEARRELALASRIAVNEGVLDTFGHISMRHPDNPKRYFLSRSSAPDMVTADSLIEYDLDSQAVRPHDHAEYSERVIHGEIYKARQDVMAICHHHSPAFMPLLATATDYVPVYHLGAVVAANPPWWDQHDEFGDTIMLVREPAEGASLARALGQHQMVMMRRHGITIVGSSVRDCTYRAVQSCRNADYLVRALSIGKAASLSPGETELAGQITGKTTGLTRSWDYWAMQIARAGGLSTSATGTNRPKRHPAAKKAAAKRGKKRGKKRRR